MGKKVAQQALMKTAWYPLVKKVGALVGKQVVKESVGKAVTKVVPVVGGAISGSDNLCDIQAYGWSIGRCAGTQSER